MSGPVKPSGACDRECVERWLLLHHPACLPGANGVKQAPHEVSARKRDSLVGKMPTRPQGAALAGVDRFDRVGRADYPAGLDVVFQERHELRPGLVRELHDCWIPLTALCGELLEPVLGCRL